MKDLIKEALELTKTTIKDFFLFAYFLAGFITLLIILLFEEKVLIIAWIKAMIAIIPISIIVFICTSFWILYIEDKKGRR